jgi:hypothetical protein
VGLDAPPRGGVLRGVLRAPGRLLGAVAGGRSGDASADGDAAGPGMSASLADMWIAFLQAQTADGDDGGAGGGAYGAAAAAMGRGEGPYGASFAPAAPPLPAANGHAAAGAGGNSLGALMPIRTAAPAPLEQLVGAGPAVA